MFKQNGEDVNKSRTSELPKIRAALSLTHKNVIINVMLLCQTERRGAWGVPTPGEERQPRGVYKHTLWNTYEHG